MASEFDDIVRELTIGITQGFIADNQRKVEDIRLQEKQKAEFEYLKKKMDYEYGLRGDLKTQEIQDKVKFGGTETDAQERLVVGQINDQYITDGDTEARTQRMNAHGYSEDKWILPNRDAILAEQLNTSITDVRTNKAYTSPEIPLAVDAVKEGHQRTYYPNTGTTNVVPTTTPSVPTTGEYPIVEPTDSSSSSGMEPEMEAYFRSGDATTTIDKYKSNKQKIATYGASNRSADQAVADKAAAENIRVEKEYKDWQDKQATLQAAEEEQARIAAEKLDRETRQYLDAVDGVIETELSFRAAKDAATGTGRPLRALGTLEEFTQDIVRQAPMTFSSEVAENAAGEMTIRINSAYARAEEVAFLKQYEGADNMHSISYGNAVEILAGKYTSTDLNNIYKSVKNVFVNNPELMYSNKYNEVLDKELGKHRNTILDLRIREAITQSTNDGKILMESLSAWPARINRMCAVEGGLDANCVIKQKKLRDDDAEYIKAIDLYQEIGKLIAPYFDTTIRTQIDTMLKSDSNLKIDDGITDIGTSSFEGISN